ncbi:hypothetical protein KVR01_000321 [Diaporthe batatas]|uniref:uncharacterized protein n=1 Tax=Diaporthe batatas TaxID=748121 RepID=UPI001D053EB4|nr:uncharacterized protein KVR01_000321 [Diaporthe batatas]KAG8169576.1 hypothetical protein KVR01_000321 [Diaporthe batatas]
MSGGESSASVIDKTSTDPKDAILTVAHQHSLFKQRSLDTAQRHLETVKERGGEMRVCLLGDSMFERMSTTGQWETLEPFPSEPMLPQLDIDDPVSRARSRGVANFGCGGDKIENILFRVVGNKELALEGLTEKLHPSGDTQRPPRLWVIHAGTNNLKPKKGLDSKSLCAMETLLCTLHHLTSPGTRFLLTGLFYRKDIRNELVDEANKQLRELVIKLQDRSTVDLFEVQPRTFEFLAPELDWDTTTSLLDDHVHLNLEGYRIWMKKLQPKIEQMMGFSPP